MAVVQSLFGQVLGWNPPSKPSLNGLTLNGAASGGISQTWLAFGFVPDHSTTLSTVRVYLNSVTGTLGTTDLVCDLYSDSGSWSPGTSLESHALGSAPTGAGFVTFSGFVTALTAGAQYWIVLRNANASPTTNFFQVGFLSGCVSAAVGGSGGGEVPQWGKSQSTNGGVSWGTAGSNTFTIRLGYGDGTFSGFTGYASPNPSPVYGTRASGVKLTAPSNVALTLRGIAFVVNSKTGAPTGNPLFQLFSGANPAIGSPLATCAALPTTGPNNGWLMSYFPSAVTVQPGTILRAVMCDSNTADTASNYYSLLEFSFDADSCQGGTVNMMPLAGSAQKTYFDGTSWTDTPTVLSPFALILDSNGEFASAGGGGGGLLLNSGMIGGLRG